MHKEHPMNVIRANIPRANRAEVAPLAHDGIAPERAPARPALANCEKPALDLDRYDLNTLGLLQESCEYTNEQLSERVLLSPSQCARRRERLRETGIIQREAAIVSPTALGLRVKAFVQVTLSKQAGRAHEVHDFVRSSPEVHECNAIWGMANYVLKVHTSDVGSLRTFVLKLCDVRLVQNVCSSIVIEEKKCTTALPLPTRGAPDAAPLPTASPRPLELDPTDYRIIALLQHSCTAPRHELAAELDISASQLSRRISRLRDLGVVQRMAAILNPEMLGLEIAVYVMVTLTERAGRAEAFHRLVQLSPEIVECCAITGNVDFILKAYLHDTVCLQRLLARLLDTNQVQTVKTNIAFINLKQAVSFSPPPPHDNMAWDRRNVPH